MQEMFLPDVMDFAECFDVVVFFLTVTTIKKNFSVMIFLPSHASHRFPPDCLYRFQITFMFNVHSLTKTFERGLQT